MKCKTTGLITDYYFVATKYDSDQMNNRNDSGLLHVGWSKTTQW